MYLAADPRPLQIRVGTEQRHSVGLFTSISVLIVWMIDWFVGWLIDRLIDGRRLTDRRANRPTPFVRSFVRPSVCLFIHSLIHYIRQEGYAFIGFS